MPPLIKLASSVVHALVCGLILLNSAEERDDTDEKLPEYSPTAVDEDRLLLGCGRRSCTTADPSSLAPMDWVEYGYGITMLSFDTTGTTVWTPLHFHATF